jgi:hypothetical protein
VTGEARLAQYLAQDAAGVLARNRSDNLEIRGLRNPACKLGARPASCPGQTYLDVRVSMQTDLPSRVAFHDLQPRLERVQGPADCFNHGAGGGASPG